MLKNRDFTLLSINTKVRKQILNFPKKIITIYQLIIIVIELGVISIDKIRTKNVFA